MWYLINSPVVCEEQKEHADEQMSKEVGERQRPEIKANLTSMTDWRYRPPLRHEFVFNRIGHRN
jgi:hypothetical protein